MLLPDFYYALKPYVPWRVRMALRQVSARRIRKNCAAVWPISPTAGRKPGGWPGWPGGKRFAFVLTHDVEGPAGLAKCRQLAELEIELGFRSTFNFIPEGNYAVPEALRAWLVGNGFEVGVHDLHHDGKLFQSRGRFAKKSAAINRYLGEWGAVGFRSAFMLRRLPWLHRLNIAYDSSTFDTDPFEPQPTGVDTIFPFWVPGSRAPQPDEPSPRATAAAGESPESPEGYVELPYTLPQDSTLFLVLRETAPGIWIQKLDWIALNEGMALVNVHPDYLGFDGAAESPRTYPVAYYRQLLEYVRDRYAGVVWQPLARDVAQFVAHSRPRPLLRQSRRVCMITHSYYENDNRVTRYAEALAARGDAVDVLALRRSPELPKRESTHGVTLYRIRDRFGKVEQSKFAYVLPLIRFLFVSSWWITWRHARKRYDFVHVHNIPDFLVLAAWFPKLTGARIILDLHDIVPEFFASKFTQSPSGFMAFLLLRMEHLSAAFAHQLIIANHLWHDRYTARTGTRGRCTVLINYVDPQVFRLRPRRRNDGVPVVIFPGGLQWHQGVDIAIRAFRKVADELPNAEFHIYGDGSAKPSLTALAAELGLARTVRFFEPLGVREIALVMGDADLGVVPKRADSFGNEAYSTKIMELMSVGVPVVVANTKVDRFYFDDTVVRFFESGNPDALAREILGMLRNPQICREQASRALDYVARNSWDSRKADYFRLVDQLCPPSGQDHSS